MFPTKKYVYGRHDGFKSDTRYDFLFAFYLRRDVMVMGMKTGPEQIILIYLYKSIYKTHNEIFEINVRMSFVVHL